MQGLPSQLLSKSSKVEAFGEKKVSTSVEGKVVGEVSGEASLAKGNNKAETEGFANLMAGLIGSGNAEGKTDGKLAELKSLNSDAIKNLLAKANEDKSEHKLENNLLKNLDVKTDKNSENKTQEKSGLNNPDAKTIDSKEAQALMASLIEGNHNGKNTQINVQDNVEQKIAKTSSNLDQLLNGLKGNQGLDESDESVGQPHGKQDKKNDVKSELKTESPLDFLLKGSKSRDVGDNLDLSLPKENLQQDGQPTARKPIIMSGEDYVKNIISSDKKENKKMALLNNMGDLQKNNPQNVKEYGMGLSLLSDPLIKNTKDLAFKETKKGSHNSAIDELRTPDTKVGAELSAIKQDMIPEIQNNKNNHQQLPESQAQVNQKVLDLGTLNTSNTNEIIKRISDYVEQNQVANKASLDLTVKHDSLGEFKIQVTKMPNQSLNHSQNSIDMQITTSSKEGHDFFVKNEVSLMKNLSQAGINLSDLRIISNMSESSPFGQSNSKQSSSFGQNADGSEKQFMSFESNNFTSDSRNGSERRKELWDEYQQRYGA